MDRKRPLWVIVFGIGFLWFSFPSLCSNIFSVAKGNITLSKLGYYDIITCFRILLIISAVGLLFLKKWARVCAVFCSTFFLIYSLYSIFLALSSTHVNLSSISSIAIYIMSFIQPLFFIAALFYFMRPAAKREFGDEGLVIFREKSLFNAYFSLKGRWNRLTFYIYLIPASFLLGLYQLSKKNIPNVICYILYLLFLYIGFVINTKRAHDRGKSVLFVLLLIIPIVDIWPVIELYFLRGEEGKNIYGEDPLQSDDKQLNPAPK